LKPRGRLEKSRRREEKRIVQGKKSSSAKIYLIKERGHCGKKKECSKQKKEKKKAKISFVGPQHTAFPFTLITARARKKSQNKRNREGNRRKD